MLDGMRPYIEKRRSISSKPREVREILEAGNQRAQLVARETLDKAKTAMGIKSQNKS